MKIVFMGTPDFSVPVLNRLIRDGHEIGYVLTQPDRARNRNKVTFSPVKEAAVEADIPVLQPDRLSSDEEVKEKLFQYQPDAIIVVAYGQILKKDILDLPRYGCFNVHGSLLPHLRGAAPMQHAILEGLERTGVTIMKMNEGLDTGDMVASAETLVDHKTFEDLHDELAELGADLMSRTLPEIEAGTCRFTPQDDSLATYAKRLQKEDGRIDFRKSPASIEQQIRAFDPWPGAFCDYQGKTMKVWKAECPSGTCQEEPGTVISVQKEGIDVSCGGGILRLTRIQMPGKKKVDVADFLLGNRMEEGTILL